MPNEVALVPDALAPLEVAGAPVTAPTRKQLTRHPRWQMCRPLVRCSDVLQEIRQMTARMEAVTTVGHGR